MLFIMLGRSLYVVLNAIAPCMSTIPQRSASSFRRSGEIGGVTAVWFVGVMRVSRVVVGKVLALVSVVLQ